MAPHSRTLAWKIPWTEEPGGLQSMGSQRVRHDWVTSLYFLLSCIGEGNGTPLQCSCLENPRDGGAWWAAVYGVAQSRTWLKRLSSHWLGLDCVCNCLGIWLHQEGSGGASMLCSGNFTHWDSNPNKTQTGNWTHNPCLGGNLSPLSFV